METGKAVRELSGTRVRGWRVWTVRETRAGVRLCSVLHDTMWTPSRVAVACCADEASHESPELSCSCGFHAAHDPVDALTYLRGRDDARTFCRVLGEVTLSGRIIETEAGWRASHAYPARLYAADTALVEVLAVYGVPVSCAECESRSSPTCTAMPPPSGLLSEIWSNVTST
ncbi:MAG: hypothetical protein H0W90_14390 [Actinobacteria bacterium]|nr:hypothetical protein [Actinomycetota bacterium]